MNHAKLAELKQKKQQLEEKIKLTEKKLAAKDRRDETRKKILIGAYYLEKHNKEESMNSLLDNLNEFLAKKHDRALFGLD